MPFTLSRGGRNVVAEVQRWQYFLRRIGVPQTGSIDGDFGQKTETGTRIFQLQSGLNQSGRVDIPTLEKARTLGYTILPDDYYEQRAGAAFPAPPAGLSSPGNDSRNRDFTCFRFLQRPLANRPDAEAIVIRGSCDGTLTDWTAEKIVEIEIPQLRFAVGYGGSIRCHHRAAAQIRRVFEAWERADLLHLVRSYEGCFVPRYIRGKAPEGTGGHGLKDSADVSTLSNHSFGSAFDINFPDNQLGQVPALCGRRGSVRELVAAANGEGLFWGGHFTRLDGMHFELAEVRD